MARLRLIPLLILLGLAGGLALSSCSTLRTSSPIFPLREYERLLVGPLEADYVGNEACLAACHQHDALRERLRQSVHGHQKDSGTGMPLVNCETCHGPGSLAIEADFLASAKRCDTSRFVPLKHLPAGARSLLCLKCHSSHSMTRMQYWPGSQHALAEVSCSDCHKLHRSARQKLEGKEVTELCLSCHPQQRTEFALFSRHPVLEGQMSCVTCHEVHGSSDERGLRAMDAKSLCARCHPRKAGPFRYEHGDLNNDCIVCHAPHGSSFAGLLQKGQPFACLECHAGHADPFAPASPSEGFKRAFYTRCTDCHSQIHGSDSPQPAHLRGGLTE